MKNTKTSANEGYEPVSVEQTFEVLLMELEAYLNSSDSEFLLSGK